MPIHDWSRVDAGLFHYFHQAWTIELSYALNNGLLPDDYYALAEQFVGGPIPDVITLTENDSSKTFDGEGGIALADAPPQASYITTVEVDLYTERANRIVVKHRHGDVVAVIEVISPGNKHSESAFRKFVTKSEELLRSGISLLVIDLLPPTKRDPQGIHKAIWDQFEEQPFELPAGKLLTIAAYLAADTKTAYVETVAVGETLPSLPIFLNPHYYIPAPLEESYCTTWDKCPRVMREIVEK